MVFLLDKLAQNLCSLIRITCKYREQEQNSAILALSLIANELVELNFIINVYRGAN